MFTHIFTSVSNYSQCNQYTLESLGFSVLWPLQECNGEPHSAEQHVFTEASYEILAGID